MRFRGGNLADGLACYNGFQYLIGAIQSRLIITPDTGAYDFQYLIGAIQSMFALTDDPFATNFQYLIGAIQSLP